MKTTIKMIMIGLVALNMTACGSSNVDQPYSVELPSNAVASLEKRSVDCRAGFVSDYINTAATELSEAQNGVVQEIDGYEFTIDVEFRSNGDAFVTHMENDQIVNTIYGFIYEGKIYFQDLCASDIVYKIN